MFFVGYYAGLSPSMQVYHARSGDLGASGLSLGNFHGSNWNKPAEGVQWQRLPNRRSDNLRQGRL